MAKYFICTPKFKLRCFLWIYCFNGFLRYSTFLWRKKNENWSLNKFAKAKSWHLTKLCKVCKIYTWKKKKLGTCSKTQLPPQDSFFTPSPFTPSPPPPSSSVTVRGWRRGGGWGGGVAWCRFHGDIQQRSNQGARQEAPTTTTCVHRHRHTLLKKEQRVYVHWYIKQSACTREKKQNVCTGRQWLFALVYNIIHARVDNRMRALV